MEPHEQIVKDHYTVGDLTKRILEGLKLAGADLDHLTIDDLAPVDEFHIGGRKATEYAISKLSLTGEERVLDVGCGIGGAARTIASLTACKITGIDLTPEYIEVAKTLTQLTGLEVRADFQAASALSMPFEDKAFDAAITFHVAMNIKDRAGLYQEIARVMKPGARLCIYDVMKKGSEPITFPMPWAETEEASHLVTPGDMEPLLETAGFEILETEDRTEFSLEFFQQSLAAQADEKPALGVHVIMGATAREKIQNLKQNIESDRIAPVQMIAERHR